MYTFQSIIIFSLVAIAVYVTLKSLLSIVAMVRSGSDEKLLPLVKRRLMSLFIYAFGHKGVMEDKSYGLMHLCYFYGFIILGIGHLELVIHGLTLFLKDFGLNAFLYQYFLPDFMVKVLAFSQDAMAALVVVIALMALYRRIFIPKARLLPRSKDAETILWLIVLLYISFFIFVPSELALNHPEHNFLWHFPISSLLSPYYGSLSHLALIHKLGFFSHLLIFLGFMAYIPSSKHLHLIAAGPNIYFRHFDSVAKPKTIDFNQAESFGVNRVDQLSWKSLLDSFACTECGRCDAVCPAALSKKPLHPKKVLHDIKINLRYDNWPKLKKYKTIFGDTIKDKVSELNDIELKPLINRDDIAKDNILANGSYNILGQIHLDDIWACTTCAACVDVCPVLIDSVPTSLIEARRHLLMMEANDYPKELNQALKGMEIQKNPWGLGLDKRLDWALSLDVPLMKDKGEVEYLFWVGCAGATDDRAKKIQQALVRLLKKANVDFAILGCEEKCSGDPARRMGNEYLFATLAQDNINTLSKYKFKKIFTTCPHCFNSLRHEYRDFGVNYSVQHHSELINELIKDKRLILNKNDDTITFHDPCYLGRYNQVYDAPREALLETSTKPLAEMSMNKRQSFCCGAGGGRMFMEEKLGKRINHERVDQALATKAKTIATACPFCMTMISDGIKDRGQDEAINVKDIAEIVLEQINT